MPSGSACTMWPKSPIARRFASYPTRTMPDSSARTAPPQDTSGAIVTTDGREVGRHEGVEQFTIGQRKGLGIAFGEPRYVVRIDAQSREVVVGTKEELARQELTAGGANWFLRPKEPLECQVKIRYRTAAVPAVVEPLSEDRFRATFLEPCYGIAPGQAAVCYRGDEVLGGGWID